MTEEEEGGERRGGNMGRSRESEDEEEKRRTHREEQHRTRPPLKPVVSTRAKQLHERVRNERPGRGSQAEYDEAAAHLCRAEVQREQRGREAEG